MCIHSELPTNRPNLFEDIITDKCPQKECRHLTEGFGIATLSALSLNRRVTEEQVGHSGPVNFESHTQSLQVRYGSLARPNIDLLRYMTAISFMRIHSPINLYYMKKAYKSPSRTSNETGIRKFI